MPFGLSILAIKAITAAAILAALTASYFGWQSHQRGIGRAETQALWDADLAKRTAEALKASEAVRARESELQSKVAKVDHDLQTQKVLRIAADKHASDSLQRLNAALASGGKSSADTSSSSGVDGDPRDGIISECSSTLVGVDQEARKLADQVISLQGYAMLVCQAK